MTLPNVDQTKFDLYMLACRELLNHLNEFSYGTKEDLRFNSDICIERFNVELNRVFMFLNSENIKDAAEFLRSGLHDQSKYFQKDNQIVSEIFYLLGNDVLSKATIWSSFEHINIIHKQGRNLACLFFSDSPCQEYLDRLNILCKCIILPNGEAPKSTSSVIGKRYGSPYAPVAYKKEYFDDLDEESIDNTIILRFSNDLDFYFYLAYPFLFLHEYTSHIFGFDYGNEMFSDGWMLYAVDKFLSGMGSKGFTAAKDLGLHPRQIYAFQDHHLLGLDNQALAGKRLARDLDTLLWHVKDDWFTKTTYEIASFSPKNEEDENWTIKFLVALNLELENDQAGLTKKILATSSIRELMDKLVAI